MALTDQQKTQYDSVTASEQAHTTKDTADQAVQKEAMAAAQKLLDADAADLTKVQQAAALRGVIDNLASVKENPALDAGAIAKLDDSINYLLSQAAALVPAMM